MIKRKILLTSLILAASTVSLAVENSNSISSDIAKSPVVTNKSSKNYLIKDRETNKRNSLKRNKVYNTKFFKIHYTNENAEFAQILVNNADNIALAESNLFKMEVPKKINVYLADNNEVSNLSSNKSQIRIAINNDNSTSNFKDYITFAFSHELAKTLLINKVNSNGLNKYTPLSRNLVTTMTLPKWFTEGTATLVESMISQGQGRTFDSSFNAVIRKDYNENILKGIKAKPNEYGNSFCKFYVETYGIEAFSDAVDYYSKHKFASVGQSFADVAKVDSDDLYDNWMVYLNNQTKTIKGNLVEGPSLFDNHSQNVNIIKGSNGQLWTYNIEKNEEESVKAGHIVEDANLVKLVFDEKTGEGITDKRKEFKVPYTGNKPAIKGNMVYYAKTIYSADKKTSYTTSYKYNMKTKKKEILKMQKRATSFVNINDVIYYTFNENGTQGIAKLNNQVMVDSGKYSINYISGTENGDIIFTGHENGKSGNQIFRVNHKTREVTFLVDGTNGYVDDNTLYYSASYGEERNNIYKKDLNSNEVTKITNVLYDSKNPIVMNNNLYYLNYSTNGYTLSRLDLKNSVNKTSDLASLEAQKLQKTNKNKALFGAFGEEYNSESHTNTVTTDELKANDNKEILGYFVPTFKTPSLSIGTKGVFVGTETSGGDTFLEAGYKFSSFASGTKSIVAPSSTTTNPLYYSFNKDHHVYNEFSGIVGHRFTSLGDTTLAYEHTDRTLVSKGIDGETDYHVNPQNRNTYHNHNNEDKLAVEVPMRLEVFDKSAYGRVAVDGDFYGENNDRIKSVQLELGYDSHTNGFFNDAKTKFGMVVNSTKANSGNAAHNYFYVDRDIKSDIPYVKSLNFLKLRTRLFFAPKRMTDQMDSSTNLIATDAGFSSLNGTTDQVHSLISNAKYAAKIYGGMQYTIPLDISSDFGKVSLDALKFKLGYSYSVFRDEDYKNNASNQLLLIQKPAGSLTPDEYQTANKMITTKENIYKTANQKLEDSNKQLDEYATKGPQKETDSLNAMYSDTTFRTMAVTIATQYKLTSQADINSAMINPALTGVIGGSLQGKAKTDYANILALDAYLKNIPAAKKTNADKQAIVKAELAKLSKEKAELEKQKIYIAQEKPKRKTKIRQGFVLNPAIDLDGGLFNDAGLFELEVGETYLTEFTDHKLDDTSLSYVSVQLRF